MGDDPHAKFLARTAELKRHTTEHTHTVYECDHCGDEDDSWMDMANHLIEEHGGRIDLGEFEEEIGITSSSNDSLGETNE